MNSRLNQKTNELVFETNHKFYVQYMLNNKIWQCIIRASYAQQYDCNKIIADGNKIELGSKILTISELC